MFQTKRVKTYHLMPSTTPSPTHVRITLQVHLPNLNTELSRSSEHTSSDVEKQRKIQTAVKSDLFGYFTPTSCITHSP
jgi:hypothetical protein